MYSPVVLTFYIWGIHVICRRQNGKRQIPRRQICRQQIPIQQTANENHHFWPQKGGFSSVNTPPLHKNKCIALNSYSRHR